ncbi:MAG: lipoprotein [Bacteroidetes bacterium]|nr:lipoprotein [Bacteroidota bacterium]
MQILKNIIIFFFLITAPVLVISQVRFNNVYDLYGTWDHATTVIPEADGYFVAGTTAGNSGWNRKLALMRIDLNGNLLWAKNHSIPSASLYDNYDAFIKTCDSNYVYAGSVNNGVTTQDVVIIKFNQNGDTLWQKTFGDTTFDWWGNQCKETLDKGFIIAGSAHVSSSNSDCLLIKTDSAGNLQWKKTINNTQERAFSVLALPDYKYLVGGTRVVGSYNQAWLAKTDSIGNLLWQRTISGSYGSAILNLDMTNDNKYVACGYMCNSFDGSFETSKAWIIKIDSAGNVVWQKQYGNEGVVTGFLSVDQSSDGSFLASGTNGYGVMQNYEINAFVLKMNSTGDSLLGREINKYGGPGSVDSFKSIKSTSDGGFITAGDFDPNNQDMWVVKFDSLGCDNLPCAMNINEYDFHDVISISPNPASETISIKVLLPLTVDNPSVNLVDYTGRILKILAIDLKSSEIFFPLEGIPSGLYFVTISDNQHIIQSKKVIISK